MKKTLTAGIASLALMVQPAVAGDFDRRDAGGLLLAVLGAAIVVKAINNNRQAQITPVHEPPVVAHQPPRHAPKIGRSTRDSGQSWSDRTTRGQWFNDRVLPRNCLRSAQTRYGAVRMFNYYCLNGHYPHAARLPEACAVRVITDDGPRRGYDPGCLRDHGYTSRR